MLSKVLTDLEAASAEARPVSWRRSAPMPSKAAQLANGRAPDELTVLRARIAEAALATEQQARQAYETGLRAGEAAARKALEAEKNSAVEQLTHTAAEVSALRGDIMRRAEADTVRLAIEIARRVLHRELSVDPNALCALAKAALERLQSQEIHRVRVHPDLERLVRTSLQQAGRGQTLSVIADPSLPPGGILFDISRGTLDASVNTQLDEIERGLTDHLDARQ